MIATLLPQRVSVQEPVAFDQGSVSLARFPELAGTINMADLEWLPARQLREYYVDPVATDYTGCTEAAISGGRNGRDTSTIERPNHRSQTDSPDEWHYPVRLSL
jgi:hypothetical protein